MSAYRVSVDVKKTYFLDVAAHDLQECVKTLERMSIIEIEESSYTSDPYEYQISRFSKIETPENPS
jgi:hypothetical protein